MRKIFTISVLSVLAVMGTASAASDLYAGAETNLNVATVNYVNDVVTDAKGIVVKSDKKTTLGGWGFVNEQTGSDDAAPTIKYMENSIAEAGAGKVNVSQGSANKNAIMITNSAGKVIPALVGECANTANKCALVTGVDGSGNQVLQWEVIARNVVQPTAGE